LQMVHFILHQKFSYQVFITRTFVEKINNFYTISISILKDKKQSTYETLFNEIKKKKQVNLITVLLFLQLIFILILKKAYQIL